MEQRERKSDKLLVVSFVIVSALLLVALVKGSILQKKLDNVRWLNEEYLSEKYEYRLQVEELEEELHEVYGLLEDDTELFKELVEHHELHLDILEQVQEEREYYKSITPKDKLYEASDAMDELIGKFERKDDQSDQPAKDSASKDSSLGMQGDLVGPNDDAGSGSDANASDSTMLPTPYPMPYPDMILSPPGQIDQPKIKEQEKSLPDWYRELEEMEEEKKGGGKT